MKSRNILLALPGALLAMTAMAAGNHAGGHGGVAEIGKPGVASQVTRTVVVDMTDDMRFHSSKIAVKQGETIRFVAKNSGKVKHEMVLGTLKELKEHYEVMKKNPEMEHADDNMVTVAPGKSGEIIWQFTKAGKVDFACLQPGHYDAGMKGLVTVVASSKIPVQGDGHADHKH
ncbi:MAG: cupredoxin family protein [Polaromonas sp.]|nr:cupredoxin family protein [Polaromonas sp.]